MRRSPGPRGRRSTCLGRIPREHRELVTALRSRDFEVALDLFAAHRRHAVEVVPADPDSS
ncbi:hypothetical protein [Streptomyces sp. NPDC059455]|uniref:hypothetical protein n=1 Tax=Streptomyces sp. NPDC059455 TaxID=3346837 RepID=UPI00367955BF